MRMCAVRVSAVIVGDPLLRILSIGRVRRRRALTAEAPRGSVGGRLGGHRTLRIEAVARRLVPCVDPPPVAILISVGIP
jgi:hypothetical protein